MVDRNTILGRGLITPFRRVGRDFVFGEGIVAVQTSVKQILLTKKGELPWRPDFGLNVERMRHKNTTETLFAEIEADILMNLLAYEPRIEVVEIQVRQEKAHPERIQVKVVWRALAQSSSRNTVLTEEETTEVLI